MKKIKFLATELKKIENDSKSTKVKKKASKTNSVLYENMLEEKKLADENATLKERNNELD